MSEINRLSESIAQVEALLNKEIQALVQSPANTAIEVTISSLKGQIKELRHHLFLENTKRQKEVISLRFMGDDAQHGSIPLLKVGGLTDAFSKTLFEVSKYIQYGKRGGKKVKKIVEDNLDLRLNAIGAGSTILYISAKTSPDLFGNSATQRAIDNFMDFIAVEDADSMIEKIPTIGTTSLQYYKTFFRKLNEDGFEVDITVNSPFRGGATTWNGSSDKIRRLFTALSELSISEPQHVNFEGEVIALSKKGKIEVKSLTGYSFHAEYPESMYEAIANLHIGQMTKGIFLKTVVENPISKNEKVEFDLVEITPVE